jgi:hypothetical protein
MKWINNWLQLWDSNPLWVAENPESLTLGDGVDNNVFCEGKENGKKMGYTMRIYSLERKEKKEKERKSRKFYVQNSENWGLNK